MRPVRVAIIGGSLGGLHAGLVLRDIGCDVQIYEQSPSAMSSRGAGIIVQEETVRFLESLGVRGRDEISTTSQKRVNIDRSGAVVRETRMFQRFTAWNTLYRAHKSLFPSALYHYSRRLVDIAEEGDTAVAFFDDGREIACDMLVCADGPESVARRLLLPQVAPRYAGYVAYRGLISERLLPPDLVRGLSDRITFFHYPGSYVYCFLVPGADGEIEEGERRLNWVWYVRAAEGPDLDRFLTDADARRRESSVPPGKLPDALAVAMRARAASELPPVFRDLVAATPDPFTHKIVDVEVPAMAFGRVALIGNAAFVVRPHTGAASAKAFADADALGGALSDTAGDVPTALLRWEGPRLEAGRYLVGLGKSLGERTVGE